MVYAFFCLFFLGGGGCLFWHLHLYKIHVNTTPIKRNNLVSRCIFMHRSLIETARTESCTSSWLCMMRYICCSDHIYLLGKFVVVFFTFFLSKFCCSVCSNKRVVHLVFDCVQGLLPAIILQTLSDPAVNCPTSQIPTVWTVTEPLAIEKEKQKRD